MREHVQIINACKCLNELRFDLMGPCIFTSGHNQISCCKSNLEKGLNNCHKKVYFITFSFKKEGGGFGTGKLSQEVFPQPSLQLAGVLLIEDWSLCQLNLRLDSPHHLSFLSSSVIKVSWTWAALQLQAFTGIQFRVIVRKGKKSLCP